METTLPSRRIRMQQNSTMIGEGGRAKTVESQVKRPQGPPRSRRQPPGGEMLGEPPAPFQSKDKGWRL